MSKRILVLLLILISSKTFADIGDNKNYWIISQTDYNERISKEKDVVLRRYIVIPGIDQNYTDIFETKDENALLAKFSFMLKQNKRSWIEKYIKSYDSSLAVNNLINGLYCFSKKQYSLAIVYLGKPINDEYKFLKLLLIADCKYELLRDKNNYKLIIGEYQSAMDNTNNEYNKSIIKNRIKYIKYR